MGRGPAASNGCGGDADIMDPPRDKRCCLWPPDAANGIPRVALLTVGAARGA
ncbi:hypothetical protein Asi02nite_63110 [Asanoa siamensis]|uniref:Uncharacterized protein n=1 Tax=Asanoa siamensis TaxID=926357 RepID=A0ABQ4D0L8_9ACTN|nr:hypothetical protein Asi02nite_63110 [Asanoa siamensis]